MFFLLKTSCSLSLSLSPHRISIISSRCNITYWNSWWQLMFLAKHCSFPPHTFLLQFLSSFILGVNYLYIFPFLGDAKDLQWGVWPFHLHVLRGSGWAIYDCFGPCYGIFFFHYLFTLHLLAFPNYRHSCLILKK